MKFKLILLGVLFLLLFPVTGRSQFLNNNATPKKEIPFAQLYGTNEWKENIQYWVASYLYTSNSAQDFAEKFVPEAEKALARTLKEDRQAALILATDLISFMEQFGIDAVAEKVAAFASGSGLSNNKINQLVSAAALMGKPAPKIEGVKDLKNSLVVFYESGCGSCDALLGELKTHYSRFKEKGIRIITVSADMDQEVYLFHSKHFLWKDKLCDYEGLDGDTFIRYGVTATPTIYEIDEKGVVQGRYARLQDVPM